jgi:hypothetical protein
VKEGRTEKTLADSTLIALVLLGATFMAVGVLLNDIAEFTVAGTTIKLDRKTRRKIADETFAVAQRDGRVQGDTVSLQVAKDLAAETAGATARVLEETSTHAVRPRARLRRGRAAPSTQGYVPSGLADELVRRAVAAERDSQQVDSGGGPNDAPVQ